MHCFSSRVTSWLTWTLRVGGFVLRRRIGASVIRPSHLGWPTQQQRRSQEAVAVLGSQTIPWDRHRQIERKFCTIVGGVISPLLANVYLHDVFDLWAERWRRREATGDMMIVRYARARGRCPALPGRDARALGGVCADAASGQDPPDRVWPLRGGPARPARARQTGDVLLPGVHPHLRAVPPGHLPAPAEEPHRPHAGDPAAGQGRAAAAHASADPRPGALAEAGGQRLLCLSCGANEPPCPHGLPPPCDRPVAAHAAAAQPKRPVHMGADGDVGRWLPRPHLLHPWQPVDEVLSWSSTRNMLWSK